MPKINEYEELIYFLFILEIWLVVILIFRLDILLGLQNLITMSAIIAALDTAFISMIYNKKALRQSEINLHKQLIYEDRKKALLSVLQIFNQQYYELDELKSEYFPEFFFLPEDTKKLIEQYNDERDEIISKIETYTFEMEKEAKESIINNVTSHLENL